jgi:hypothetical protein
MKCIITKCSRNLPFLQKDFFMKTSKIISASLVIAAALSFSVNAQSWYTSSNTYGPFIYNNGGNVQATGTNWNQGSGKAYLQLGDWNHYIKSQQGVGVSIGTFQVIDGITLRETSGNVGIGTTAPAAKLDVRGGINATGGITTATNVSATIIKLAYCWILSGTYGPTGTDAQNAPVGSIWLSSLGGGIIYVKANATLNNWYQK